VSTTDVIAIGLGPFNLGLAALAAGVPELSVRCFEAKPGFDWHPGMMIEDAVLQVPFLADLVTAAEPQSPYSFLAYLKLTGRLYQFAIREAYFITRSQYVAYCRWVAEQLPGLDFGVEITAVHHDGELYRVEGRRRRSGEPVIAHARHVVVGIGSVPSLPGCLARPLPAGVSHSSEYLNRRASLRRAGSVIVVGSGQSAAEVFHDLVRDKPEAQRVTWLTRSPRFFPMDYSKLALEMATPDYVDHFHRLPAARRREVLASHDDLYRGIGAELIGRIYDLLYDRSSSGPRDDVSLCANVALEGVRSSHGQVLGRFRQLELDQPFERACDHLVLATGYEQARPGFLAPLEPSHFWPETDAPRVDRGYQLVGAPPGLYVQNAESATHGFGASDLSMGPYRNSIILNGILGRAHFLVEKRIAFQDFGVPREASARAASEEMSA
jgi:lysine N6-hydroxylase